MSDMYGEILHEQRRIATEMGFFRSALMQLIISATLLIANVIICFCYFRACSFVLALIPVLNRLF